MGPVRMVQVTLHHVIDVIPVWHPVVAAVCPVHMVLWMMTAVMLGCAVRGVRCANRQDMVINVIAMDVMQMPIVQIVGMVAVSDSRMTAARSMLVVVPLMHVTVLLSHPTLLRVFE